MIVWPDCRGRTNFRACETCHLRNYSAARVVFQFYAASGSNRFCARDSGPESRRGVGCADGRFVTIGAIHRWLAALGRTGTGTVRGWVSKDSTVRSLADVADHAQLRRQVFAGPEWATDSVECLVSGCDERAGTPHERSAYLEQPALNGFETFSSVMSERSRENWESSVPATQRAALLAIPLDSAEGAKPAGGRFPTVLYIGGLNADLNANVILGEFLASHGYIVASVSLLGASDEQTSQSRSAGDLEATVRDAEFGLQLLGEDANADTNKVAVLGHSLGAVAAMILAMRNGNVEAVAGLDGTYGFRGSTGVLTNSYGYSPEKLRAAVLDLRRAAGPDTELDLSALESFRFAHRMLVTLPNVHHSDFTSFASVAQHFDVPILPKYAGTGWNRETGKLGYQQACRIVLGFLNDKLQMASGASALRNEVGRLERSVVRELAGGAAPPSPPEAVAFAGREGIEALKKRVAEICGDPGLGSCVDAGAFNSYGYELLGHSRKADAVTIFEIAAWSHPESANAQDSLADGYLAVGEKEKARAAIRRAITLAPGDASMDAAAKAVFVAEENRRLNQID